MKQSFCVLCACLFVALCEGEGSVEASVSVCVRIVCLCLPACWCEYLFAYALLCSLSVCVCVRARLRACVCVCVSSGHFSSASPSAHTNYIWALQNGAARTRSAEELSAEGKAEEFGAAGISSADNADGMRFAGKPEYCQLSACCQAVPAGLSAHTAEGQSSA